MSCRLLFEGACFSYSTSSPYPPYHSTLATTQHQCTTTTPPPPPPPLSLSQIRHIISKHLQLIWTTKQGKGKERRERKTSEVMPMYVATNSLQFLVFLSPCCLFCRSRLATEFSVACPCSVLESSSTSQVCERWNKTGKSDIPFSFEIVRTIALCHMERIFALMTLARTMQGKERGRHLCIL